MRRVDADFQRLQPVAVDMALEGEGVAVGRDKTVDLGKGWRLAFAEIRPEDAALLDHGIGALFDALAELRVLWLGRRLQALARGVEQPAVKGAAQPAVLQPSEGEVGAAMRAMPLDQAVAARFVAKQHQVFAKQFDGTHRPRTRKLLDARRRLPVHPHQLPARLPWPGAGDQVVLFLAHHDGTSFSRWRRISFGFRLLALNFPARDFLVQGAELNPAFPGCCAARRA